MRLDVDHVVFGGTDLDVLAERFARIGLEGVYGGTHADGTTHMRVVPFPDGSYLELIAPTAGTAPENAGYWPSRLAADAGPTAWALRVDDPRPAAIEAIESGFSISGPTPGGRETTEGTRLEWDAVVVEADRIEPIEADGETLPFVVADRTPREWRVPPAAAATGPIRGVGTILLAVSDPTPWIRRFRRLTTVSTATTATLPGIDGTVHVIPGSPIALVVPAAGSDLDSRLDDLGHGPCGYLFAVDGMDDARGEYPLGDPWSIAGRDGAWFEEERGVLGVVSNRPIPDE